MFTLFWLREESLESQRCQWDQKKQRMSTLVTRAWPHQCAFVESLRKEGETIILSDIHRNLVLDEDLCLLKSQADTITANTLFCSFDPLLDRLLVVKDTNYLEDSWGSEKRLFRLPQTYLLKGYL